MKHFFSVLILCGVLAHTPVLANDGDLAIPRPLFTRIENSCPAGHDTVGWVTPNISCKLRNPPRLSIVPISPSVADIFEGDLPTSCKVDVTCSPIYVRQLLGGGQDVDPATYCRGLNPPGTIPGGVAANGVCQPPPNAEDTYVTSFPFPGAGNTDSKGLYNFYSTLLQALSKEVPAYDANTDYWSLIKAIVADIRSGDKIAAEISDLLNSFILAPCSGIPAPLRLAITAKCNNMMGTVFPNTAEETIPCCRLSPVKPPIIGIASKLRR
jgi:hypothetical protein